MLFNTEVPSYSPKFLIELNNNGLNVEFEEKNLRLDNLTYMLF